MNDLWEAFHLKEATATAEFPHMHDRGPWYRRAYKYIRKYWFIYMLVLPGLAFMLMFNYGPMYGIQLAFKDFNVSLGIWGSPWVGFKHFGEMFHDQIFWQAFRNTVLINVYNLVFGFTFSVFLALMINEILSKKLKSVVQTFVYLPYFLSWVIFAGLVTTFLNGSDDGGMINSLISMFGGKEIEFLRRPELFRTILVISAIIKTSGYSTIIYLAGIAGINPSLYESAWMDGANRFHALWYITIPRILPTIAIMFILQVAGLFSSNFDQVYNLYNTFVYSTGDVLSTYIYRNSIGGGGNYEVSTAMNLILNLGGMMIVLVTNKFVKKLDVMGIV